MSALLGTCMGLMPGCTQKSQDVNAVSGNEDKMGIVCTTFPQYDWVRQIIGDQLDQYELTLLLDNGVDLHSYQPTAEDIAKISNCDLFIYVGGESDGWVEDALKEATNDKMQVINLMQVLGDQAKEEEVVEGMQEGEHHHEDGEKHEHEGEEVHEENHEHEGEEAHETSEEGHKDEVVEEAAHSDEHQEVATEENHEEVEYDEHVWLSLANAQVFVEQIASAIEKIDTDDAELYKANTKAYIEQLSELDQQYETMVNQAERKTVLFGDRFPFRYMVDDYDIDYYAAFVGCSAETEASFETITFLSGKVDELSLPAILVIENSDQKIASTISQNTKTQDQEILVMDSIQSISREELEGDYSYLGAMQSNLETLKTALN